MKFSRLSDGISDSAEHSRHQPPALRSAAATISLLLCLVSVLAIAL